MKKHALATLMVLALSGDLLGEVKPPTPAAKEMRQQKQKKKKKNLNKKRPSSIEADDEQNKEITPYDVAINISLAVNWLTDPTNEFFLTDAEPLIVRQRKVASNIYKAEGFCLITIADHLFPSTREKNFSKLLNWPDLHPLLGKDVYEELQKFADINFDYQNDTSLKARQSDVARYKIREALHENILSIIDFLNKVTGALPAQFYYSGHPYESIAALDHILLYELLADSGKVTISDAESCYHRWQAMLYKNMYLMTKLIAQRLLQQRQDPDIRDILKKVALREPGDDNIKLPSCGL